MTSEQAITKTFRLSSRVSVEMTVGLAGFLTEWTPALPERLTGHEMRAYRRARKEMVERLAEITGQTIAVFEVEDNGGLSLGEVVEKKQSRD